MLFFILWKYVACILSYVTKQQEPVGSEGSLFDHIDILLWVPWDGRERPPSRLWHSFGSLWFVLGHVHALSQNAHLNCMLFRSDVVCVALGGRFESQGDFLDF